MAPCLDEEVIENLLLLEKLTDRLYCRVRLFLHNPMSGIGDNAALNIGADLAHDFGLLRSERLLRAQRQNRHGQLGFGCEQLVV